VSSVSDEAIILQVFAYGETSRILRLLTAGHGLRSALARGALRPRSRFGGVLEPFAEGIATMSVRPSRDLQTLTAFELTRAPTGLGSDLLRFAGASLVAEIVLRTGSEESQPAFFHAVRDTLEQLRHSAGPELEAVILARAWYLVDQLGFAPALAECVECGRALAPGMDVRFDFAAGGVRCDACGAGAPGRDLPAHGRAAIQELLKGRTPVLERTAAHWQLLRRHLEHHVVDGPLRSFAFLDATVSSPT
jgi:DNA repair protein RecO (recombination protein O)